MRQDNVKIVERDPRRARAVSAVSHQGMLEEEGLFWLDSSRLGGPLEEGPAVCVNTGWGAAAELLSDLRPAAFYGGPKPGTEAAGTEANRTEAAGTEANRAEADRTEAAGTEVAGAEADRTEAAGAEANRAEANRTEAAGTEAAGTEADGIGASAQDQGRPGMRVNLLALGDVGGTVLIGLKLLGGGAISRLGICDISPQMCSRWECEMNQIAYPWDYDALPPVSAVPQEELFDCDVFVFCASKAVPPIGGEAQRSGADKKSGEGGEAGEGGQIRDGEEGREALDVRMIQFEANRKIVGSYARMARKAGFRGLFAVVSDPVDPLCREAFLESNRPDSRFKGGGADGGSGAEAGDFDGKGLRPEQIQGYGLGVMNGRAAYYAKKEERFASFLTEGRAYGPHGKDLVIANSIENYDDGLSKELTGLAAEANIRIRELGFKPYIAPALSSAALSLLLTMKGQWHYSSVFLGGVFMGCKNRFGEMGLETESLPLPEELYRRLKYAYDELDKIT